MPVHSSGLVSEGQPTFRLYATRIASRLARGHAPLNPAKAKGRECGEARQARPHCRRRACVPGGACLHGSKECISLSVSRMKFFRDTVIDICHKICHKKLTVYVNNKGVRHAKTKWSRIVWGKATLQTVPAYGRSVGLRRSKRSGALLHELWKTIFLRRWN